MTAVLIETRTFWYTNLYITGAVL